MKPSIALLGAAGIATSLAGCTAGFGQSDASTLYNYCINDPDTSFLDQYNGYPDYKAMAAGIVHDGGGSRYSCFTVANKFSQQEAVDEVLQNCRAKFPDCRVVAQGGQLEAWALAEQNGGGSGGAGHGAEQALGALALGVGVASALMGAGAFDGGATYSPQAIGAGLTSAFSGAAAMTGNYDAETAAAFQAIGGGVTSVGSAFASSGASGMYPVGGGTSAGYGSATGGGSTQRGLLDDCAELYGSVADVVPEAQALMAECRRRAANMSTIGYSGTPRGSCPAGTYDVGVMGGPLNCIAPPRQEAPGRAPASDITGLYD